jgi:hypothetical protein
MKDAIYADDHIVMELKQEHLCVVTLPSLDVNEDVLCVTLAQFKDAVERGVELQYGKVSNFVIDAIYSPLILNHGITYVEVQGNVSDGVIEGTLITATADVVCREDDDKVKRLIVDVETPAVEIKLQKRWNIKRFPQ